MKNMINLNKLPMGTGIQHDENTAEIIHNRYPVKDKDMPQSGSYNSGFLSIYNYDSYNGD